MNDAVNGRKAIPTLMYVGTYTRSLPWVQAQAEGIYLYRFDPSTGALTQLQVTPGIDNPSFLALHPSGRYLYAANEIGSADGSAGGTVSAFAIDPATHALTPLNQQLTHGVAPCHVAVDAGGRWLLTANYTSGSIASFPILNEGQLGPAADFVQHTGASHVTARQAGPHAHSVNLDAANRLVLVCDLGKDEVLIYQFDRSNGRLTLNDPASVALHPGSGPRHLAFHPSERYAYVISELGNTVSAYTFDAARGVLSEIQTLSTLPDGFSGVSHTADIHVHPNGKFLYGSNRGHDSITIYAIDAATGTLTHIGNESTRGRTPRNFTIDPTGTFLLAANQDTSNVASFRIDPERGTLTLAAESPVPTPVCLKFA